MDKSFLSIKELASKVGVSQKTVYRMINAGQIPSAVKIGGQWRFNVNAVHSWLASSTSNSSDVITINSTISVAAALQNGSVLYRIHGRNRDEALEELLTTLPQTGGLDARAIRLATLAQESLASSSMKGVAVMRPSREAPFFVDRSLIIMAYLEKPTDFKASDGQKAEVILLTLPANIAEESLLAMRLSRMLMEPSFVEALKREMSRREFMEFIEETERNIFGQPGRNAVSKLHKKTQSTSTANPAE